MNNNEYNFQTCDCCDVNLGLSEFTTIEHQDSQILICEDCKPI